MSDLEVLVTTTLKITEDHKDRWGRIKGAQLKKKTKPPGDFPSGPVVKSLPLQGVSVQSPVGGSQMMRGVAKKTEHKPICVCAQGCQQEEGPFPALPCRSSEVTEIPFLSCSLEPFASGLTFAIRDQLF